MLLAGDIGGTKTLLALFEKGDARTSVAEQEFHSADFKSLDDMVRKFLQDKQQKADRACFDVAGPVIDGHAHLTNLPWKDLDEAALQDSLNIERVALINDLRAIAYAVPKLRDDEKHVLSPGKPAARAPMAVVAPGTGLGEAFLVWQGESYMACASEGGHASFAPTDDKQIGLLQALAKKFGHVSVERVCSGPGIANIYTYLRDADPKREPASFTQSMAKAGDPTPLISQAGLDGSNPLAREALDMFVAILASECANMALKILATGGVYLAGGIPAHILPRLTREHVVNAFVNKGRLGKLLSDIPIHVVTARAALLGAALYGMEQMQ
jgi:glucokinase